MGMPTGTIARLLIDKGFGFIRDEGGIEHFFHRSAVRGAVFELLREGQRVEFTPEESAKGPRAGDIADSKASPVRSPRPGAARSRRGAGPAPQRPGPWRPGRRGVSFPHDRSPEVRLAVRGGRVPAGGFGGRIRSSERGPVALPVFKTGRSPLCGGAGFDSQALPPAFANLPARPPPRSATARRASPRARRLSRRSDARTDGDPQHREGGPEAHVRERVEGGPSEGALDRFIRDEYPGVLDAGESDGATIRRRTRGNCRAWQGAGRYHHAAWVATDAVAESKGSTTGITTYVGRQDADGWTVVFGRLSEAGDKFLVVQEAKVKDADSKVAVKAFSPPREETAFFPSAARALATARDQWWRTDRQYNFAVIPASSGQVFVYAIPIQTDLEVFPLGGDTRYLVSADGNRILERREMHRAITFFTGPRPAAPPTSTSACSTTCQRTATCSTCSRGSRRSR